MKVQSKMRNVLKFIFVFFFSCDDHTSQKNEREHTQNSQYTISLLQLFYLFFESYLFSAYRNRVVLGAANNFYALNLIAIYYRLSFYQGNEMYGLWMALFYKFFIPNRFI